jgi:gamma-glutamyltranspeptidase/glutathione hydrolase
MTMRASPSETPIASPSTTSPARWPWLGRYEPLPALAGFRPVLGVHGMVSSPHAAATAIGVDVLKSGGNAVDAAVATSAALMVTCPMQGGPGGDAFWMIAAEGEIHGLDASGRAPAGLDQADLRRRGLDRIPLRSGESVTAPGAVDGWITAHRRFGSRPFAALLEPAAVLADEGPVVSRHIRASFAAAMPELRAKGAETLWDCGTAGPELYSRLRQPRLADTLRQIATSDGRAPYEGPLAAAIVEVARRFGSPLTLEDLAAHQSDWVAPLSSNFRGLTVHTTPPSTQGFALLAALAFVESCAPEPLDVFDPATVHLLIEACRAALEDRDRCNGDRAHLEVVIGECWSGPRAHLFLQTFDSHQRHDIRPALPRRIARGDTSHLAIVDRDGMGVSLIQSLFFDFGACIPVPSGGFTLQNRAAAFALEEGPSALRPGARPPSTLTPTIVTRADCGLYAILGCMGGDGQVQTQAQILLDLTDGGLDAQQAVSRPRWCLDRTADKPVVVLESGVSTAVVQGLRARGHAVEVRGPSEDFMGHAQAICQTTSGVMIGAADPRSDGLACGV